MACSCHLAQCSYLTPHCGSVNCQLQELQQDLEFERNIFKAYRQAHERHEVQERHPPLCFLLVIDFGLQSETKLVIDNERELQQQLEAKVEELNQQFVAPFSIDKSPPRDEVFPN